MGRGRPKSSGGSQTKKQNAKSSGAGEVRGSGRVTKQPRVDELLKTRRSLRRRNSGDKSEKKEDVILELSNTASVGLIIEDQKTKKAPRASVPTTSLPKEKSVKLGEEKQREILVKFDLDPVYGPCRGISRLQRYTRAIRFSIKPKPEDIIVKILEDHKDNLVFQKCIWDQKLK